MQEGEASLLTVSLLSQVIQGAVNRERALTILSLLAGPFHRYAPDRPGHGLSDPFDYRGVDLFELSATFLGDVLDNCGLRTVPLMGCSMGGLSAIAFYLRHPDRVSQLILPGMPAGLQRAVPPGIYQAQ